MIATDSRRRRGRQRLRPGQVEALEVRQLMASSPFDYSLPQLSVTGYGPTAASWGTQATVDVTVENLGASSIIEPAALAPGSASSADSAATTVQVYATTKPGAKSGVLIDTINIPAIAQNTDYQTISLFALPSRPKGFPSGGGKIYLTFVVNNNQTVLQASNVDNIYRDPTPVTIVPPLPDIKVVAFDIPQPLAPGDVVTPTIRIANFGTSDPGAQAPVVVDLVASLDKNFGPGDAVVGSFTINSLPGVNDVPTQGSIANNANVIPAPNEFTTTLGPIKLPTTPGFYYLGIKIDPFSVLKQATPITPALSDPVPVGPAGKFLSAAPLLGVTNGVVPVFPARPSTIFNPLTGTPVTVPIFPNTPINPLAPVNRSTSAKAVKVHSTAKAKH